MSIQYTTPANYKIFYWYLDGDRIIPMTNNDVNNPGWSRPYTSNRLDDAWQFVFNAKDNGVTIETFSNHLDRHQLGFASRLIGIMTQCGIWQIDGNVISNNPNVADFTQCQIRLQEFYDNRANHVPEAANDGTVVLQVTPPNVPAKGDANHPPVVDKIQKDKKSKQDKQSKKQKNAIMPNPEQITALATAIDNYLRNFKSEEDDGITANMLMDDKLNSLYHWDMPLNIPNYIHLQGNTSAEQTISLKIALHNRLINKDIPVDDKNHDLNWFVGFWGGITRYQNYDHLDRFNYWRQAFNIPGQYQPFNANGNNGGIASWSKVACILSPQEYAIYDVRVTRSINSISMLQLGNAGLRFPEPSGRNPKLCLSNVDYERIVNDVPVNNEIFINDVLQQNGYLFAGHGAQQQPFLKDMISPGNCPIVNKDHAYNTYLNLLGQVSNQLFNGDANRLQKTEMFLFALADHKRLYIQVIRRLKGWPEDVV